jgi:chromosome segregation ATPase
MNWSGNFDEYDRGAIFTNKHERRFVLIRVIRGSHLLFQKCRSFAPIAAAWFLLAASPNGATQPAQVAGMAQGIAKVPAPGAPLPLPTVSVELRTGSALPTVHDIHDVGFLIGTVPGCDLRLPGSGLPSVICLISRYATGVQLRKLAPLLRITVNGEPAGAVALSDGDRIGIGPVELGMRIRENSGAAVGWVESSRPTNKPEAQARDSHAGLEESTHPTKDAEQARRLAELEKDLQRREKEISTRRLDLERRETALRQPQSKALADPQQGELASVHRELAELRRQLVTADEKSREYLAKQQAAVRQAAQNLQARKQEFERESRNQSELFNKWETAEAERKKLAEECRQWREQSETMQGDLHRRSVELQSQDKALRQARADLDKSLSQHRADLVRLDRRQGDLEQREQELNSRSDELTRAHEQLRQNVVELEEQAAQMDEWHTKLAADAEALMKKQEEHQSATAQLHQRAAALEGQQAMLAALRTRLERMREELRTEEKQLAEQRVAHAASEADLQRLLKEAEELRAELENEKQLRESESAKFRERQALMESAVTHLREAQEAAGGQETALRQRETEIAAKSLELDERAAILEGRAQQLTALQERMTADRDALSAREAALAKAEQSLAGLQEQLRRRSEELSAAQKAQSEQGRKYDETIAALDARRKEIDRERQQAEEHIADTHKELDQRTEELNRRIGELEQVRSELVQREDTLVHSIERLKAAGRAVGQGRKELADERAQNEQEKQRAFASLSQAHRDFETAREEVIELQRRLPEMEAQAREAAARLTQAREQLHGHMAETYAYTRQSREDLELLRAQLRAEAERVRQQESALHRGRDEHRLAVAEFRRQLIDWHGQVEEFKRALARDENRLERKTAEVDRRVRAVDEAGQRLARQAEELEQQERAVVERRGEVERHLEDMRVWYRRKLRELAGIRDGEEKPEAAAQQGDVQDRGESAERDILSLTGDISAADRQLGDLLQSHQLVDAETLTALLIEARRQRRSLRQLLLAGNHLTLYQLALIEAGNLNALMMGPVRVVDRLRTIDKEVIYRVFDPRRNQEALLRQLSEDEMLDAVRPDEYRQRFSAAAGLSHIHIAGTFEVLELAGRPAVLQEALKGLPSCDWPPLTGTPGVWYRLVNQAFLGIQAAHQAGLVHGHISVDSLLLTAEGVLKLCGFGEPAWLHDPSGEESTLNDIAALGAIAAAWAEHAATGRRSRSKPMPDALQEVLHRLKSPDPAARFADASEVLEALERAGAEVPANAAAWDRFVRHVAEQSADAAARLSA